MQLPIILYLVSSLVFIGAGMYVLLDKDVTLLKLDRRTIITLLIASLILSFPMIGKEYLLRFSLIIFIPQSILLLIRFGYLKGPSRMFMKIFISVIVLLSIFITSRVKRAPILSENEVEDLHLLKKRIADPESTLVISRHGLEWWKLVP